jgi:hypothetical protein
MQVGFICTSASIMPELSTWNTATVLARGIELVGRRSSSGMALIWFSRPDADRRSPCRRRMQAAPCPWMRSMAFWITVSVLRPRKSNFTSPACSTHFMLNWVAGMSERGSR